jgi:hypothetical protein
MSPSKCVGSASTQVGSFLSFLVVQFLHSLSSIIASASIRDECSKNFYATKSWRKDPDSTTAHCRLLICFTRSLELEKPLTSPFFPGHLHLLLIMSQNHTGHLLYGNSSSHNLNHTTSRVLQTALMSGTTTPRYSSFVVSAGHRLIRSTRKLDH